MTHLCQKGEAPTQLSAVDKCNELGITDENNKPPTPLNASALLNTYEAFMRHLPAIRLLAADDNNWVDIGDAEANGKVFRFKQKTNNKIYTYIHVNLQNAPEHDCRVKTLKSEGLKLRLDMWGIAQRKIQCDELDKVVKKANNIQVQDSDLSGMMKGTDANNAKDLFAMFDNM